MRACIFNTRDVRAKRAPLNDHTKCTRSVHRQRHTVRDARISYAEAWRVIAAARAIQTMRKTIAAQRILQMRERACGNARDMLPARAPRTATPQLIKFAGTQKWLADHMSRVWPRRSYACAQFYARPHTCAQTQSVHCARQAHLSQRQYRMYA